MSSVSQTPSHHPTSLRKVSPGSLPAPFPHLALPGSLQTCRVRCARPSDCPSSGLALGHSSFPFCLPRVHITSPLPHYSLRHTLPHSCHGQLKPALQWTSCLPSPACHPRPLMPTLTPPPASGWHGRRPAPQPPWTRWDHSSCWPRRSPHRLCRERVAEPEDCPQSSLFLETLTHLST